MIKEKELKLPKNQKCYKCKKIIKEEWGGWKIVSDMLDHPDENGIYPTGKCYQGLYEFVVAQKEKARQDIIEKIEEVPRLEITHKDGTKSLAILEHSLKTHRLLK